MFTHSDSHKFEPTTISQFVQRFTFTSGKVRSDSISSRLLTLAAPWCLIDTMVSNRHYFVAESQSLHLLQVSDWLNIFAKFCSFGAIMCAVMGL